MAGLKESIKESLTGTTEEPPLSQEVRANFLKHARPDEQGELYMGAEEFVDAIAPLEEDYVGCVLSSRSPRSPPLIESDHCWTTRCALLTRLFLTAQDQARTVQHPLPSCRSAENREDTIVGLGHL